MTLHKLHLKLYFIDVDKNSFCLNKFRTHNLRGET